MKYRIVERNDGWLEVQSKNCYFFRWRYRKIFLQGDIDRAKQELLRIIKKDSDQRLGIKDDDVKKVIEEWKV